MKINRPILSILSQQIAPAFFAEDAGGGGGAAVIEAPAAPAAEPGGQNDGILDFEPPDPDAVMAAIKSGDDMPLPQETKKEAPAQKEKKQADPAKPAGKKEGESPVAQLRSEYEATKARLAEAEQRLAAGDPRLKQYEEDVKAAKREVEEERTRVKELNERLVGYDAANADEVKQLDSDYQKRRATFEGRVYSIDGNKVWDFVNELAGIPAGDRAKQRELADKVNIALGGNEDARHPDLDKTLDFIEASRDYAISRQERIAEVKAKADEYQVEKSAKHYSTVRSRVDDLIEKGQKIPDGIADSNPNHPRLMVSKFEEALGESAKKVKAGLQEVTRIALAGVRPRNSKDFQGMTPEEVHTAQREEAQKVERYRDVMAEEFQNFGMAYYAMPPLIRENAKLKAQLAEYQKSTPPDPSVSREAGQESDEDGDDVKNFVPPDLNKVRF